MRFNLFIYIFNVILFFIIPSIYCLRTYTKDDIAKLREEVRDMFQHAYQGYLRYASDYDELRPLTCDGEDTWGSYSLTLIDALDTLAVMGNYSEFRRVTQLLVKKMDFNKDINVSVFETNIRIVGGLLSAHLLSRKAGVDLEPGWPCNGPLLRMAEDVAKRLLPAFNTATGMPYGTVNLKYGVPVGETSITCTAGVGTFIVEFGALSRLTGDPIYEEVAFNALYSLWKYRSPIGLFGNHIDVQTGRWTAQDAGIGAGVDSYYEYLVKGSIMLNRPDLLEMFHIGRKSIDKFLKRDDWYIWVSMNKGQVTLPVFQSLEAYWPGVLSLIGDINSAMKTIHNYHTVWKQYGFLPEFYNIPSAEAGNNRENYPLRPELIESAMYLYRATKDPYLLEIGEDMLRSIELGAKTPCGYATIKNVRNHLKDNRMESFFLAETTKYLYLLFDPDNFLHNDGREGVVFDTPNGECIIEAGGYIFNTEAHPIDPSALHCCYDLPRQDIFANFNLDDYNGNVLAQKDRIKRIENQEKQTTFECSDTRNASYKLGNLTIDIEIVNQQTSDIRLPLEIENIIKEAHIEEDNIENSLQGFQIKSEFTYNDDSEEPDVDSFQMHDLGIIWDKLKEKPVDSNESEKYLNLYQKMFEETKQFMIEQGINKQNRLKLNVPNQIKNLYELYENEQMKSLFLNIFDNIETLKKLNNRETVEICTRILNLLDSYNNNTEEEKFDEIDEEIVTIILKAQLEYKKALKNLTAMMDFLQIFSNNSEGYKEFNQNIEYLISKIVIFQEDSITTNNKLDSSILAQFRLIVEMKKRRSESILKIQSILLKSISPMKNKNKNDDIIVNDENQYRTQWPNKDPGNMGSVESSKQSSASEKPEDLQKYFKQKPSTSNSDLLLDETTNNSILTNFVQSIIKSTLPAKPAFDSQLFLENIRKQGTYTNVTENYELLTCRSQNFLQRFAHRGEFFEVD